MSTRPGEADLEASEFEAAFLLVDIRGFSRIVYELGPHNPRRAGVLARSFWSKVEPIAKSLGGDIYAWQGDCLLVAYRGTPRERALRALKTAQEAHAVAWQDLVPQCWELLTEAAHEVQYAGTGQPPSRATQFAVSSAISDGSVTVVPRSDGRRYTEELTGDTVNLVFSITKAVPPWHIGVTKPVYEQLKGDESTKALVDQWAERSLVLCGALREIASVKMPILDSPVPDIKTSTASASRPSISSVPA